MYRVNDTVNIFRYVLVNGVPQRERFTFIRAESAIGRPSGSPKPFKLDKYIKDLEGKWLWDSGENMYIKVEKKNVGDGGIWSGNPLEFPLQDGVMLINRKDYDNLIMQQRIAA